MARSFNRRRCVLNTNFVDWWRKMARSFNRRRCVLNTNFVDWWQYTVRSMFCCVLNTNFVDWSPIVQNSYSIHNSTNLSYLHNKKTLDKIVTNLQNSFQYDPYPNYTVTNLQNSYSIHNIACVKKLLLNCTFLSPIYKIRIQYTTSGFSC